ncbi:MAG: hypothetical protein MUF54_02225 [Polyangiaceae bacterium]|nr:hypothetical protein [Polyangiaceae bacterium]
MTSKTPEEDRLPRFFRRTADKNKLSVGDLPMNFKIGLDARVRAAAGVPAFVRRRRRIEDLEQATLLALDEFYDEELLEHEGNEQEAYASWFARVQQIDLTLLNDLIERHNRWYPVEANLPTDVTTGRILDMGVPWKPMALRTWQDFVRQFEDLRRNAEDSEQASEEGNPIAEEGCEA